jgi:predicted ATPase
VGVEGKRLIRTLHLQNLLSFGPESEEITLEPLNMLIGSNASGKSNLIESMAILRATPKDLTAPILEGGGIGEWLWKGGKTIPTATVEATVAYPEGIMPLRYRLCMTRVGQRLEVTNEAVENERPSKPSETDVDFFYRFQHGNPALNVRMAIGVHARAGTDEGRTRRHLRREDLSPELSILSQRKDPDQYPEITYLGDQFANIRLYREWNLGRYTALRMPQRADLPDDFLLEDASNLEAARLKQWLEKYSLGELWRMGEIGGTRW